MMIYNLFFGKKEEDEQSERYQHNINEVIPPDGVESKKAKSE